MSCDFFLGVPFNIASYSLLTYIFADCLGYYPDEFVWKGGDVHLYSNHLEQAKEQLSRTPYPPEASLTFKIIMPTRGNISMRILKSLIINPILPSKLLSLFSYETLY